MWWVLYIVAVVAIVIAISRIVAVILAKILSKILKKDISIDYIGFFSLQNVRISIEKSSLVVDSISLKWRLLNPEQRHLVCLYIGDSRIQTELNSSTSTAERKVTNGSNTGFPLNSWIISLVRLVVTWMSFQIESCNIMLLNAVTSDSLMHLTIQDVQITADNKDDRLLSAEASSTQISWKVLKSARSSNDSCDRPCIADFSCNVQLSSEMDLLEQKLVAVQVGVGKPSIEIHEGFLQTDFKTRERNTDPATNVVETAPDAQKLNSIMKILPQSVKVDINGIHAKISVQSKNRFICLEIGSILLLCNTDSDRGLHNILENLVLPHTTLQCVVSATQLSNSSSRKLFSLTKFQTDMKLTELQVGSVLLLQSCHIQYLQDEVTFWYQQFDHFLLPWKQTEEQIDINEVTKTIRPKSILNQLKLPVEFIVNLSNLSASVIQPDVPEFSAVASTVQANACIECVQQNNINIKGNIHGEQLYCYVGEAAKFTGHFSIKKHLWGTPYAMHAIDIQYFSSYESLELKVDTQYLQLECSNEILDVTEHILETFKMLRESASSASPTSPTKKTFKRGRKLDVQFTLHDMNGFVCSSADECLMLRMDNLMVVSNYSRSEADFEGILFTRVQKIHKSHDCITFAETPKGIFNLERLNLTLSGDPKEIGIEITNSFCIQWTPTDHMTMYHSIQEVLQHITKKEKSTD